MHTLSFSIWIKIYDISIQRESTHRFASTCFIHKASKTFFSAWINVYLSLLSYSILVMESILCETTSFTSVNGNCFEWRGQLDMSQSIWQWRGRHRGFISNDLHIILLAVRKTRQEMDIWNPCQFFFVSHVWNIYADENSIYLIEFILHCKCLKNLTSMMLKM